VRDEHGEGGGLAAHRVEHHGGEWPEHRRRRDGVAASRQQVEAEGDHVEERDRGGDAEQPAA